MTLDDLTRVAAAVAGALAETTARFAYATLAALALLLAVAARGGVPAEAVDAAGGVALAVLLAWVAFTVARLLLVDEHDDRQAVTA